MSWHIIIVLLLLWMFGMATGYTMKGAVNALVAVAGVLAVITLVRKLPRH